jgi:hypothetical protein
MPRRRSIQERDDVLRCGRQPDPGVVFRHFHPAHLTEEEQFHVVFICPLPWENSQNLWEAWVSITFSAALKELAEPRPAGDLVKRAIERAARLTGLSYTRAFDVWYGKARRIDAHEAAQIAEALQQKREEEARNELHDLRARLLKMESRLAADSSDSARPGLNLVRARVR